MNPDELKNLRNEYKLNRLTEDTVHPDPFEQFDRWFGDVIRCEIAEPTAMTLATASKDCTPTARTVLLKGVKSGGFIFFTNYESRKGKELDENPKATLLFFWKELERQVRIEGIIEKVSRKESEDYFHTRPRESQISAWVSHQSEVVPNRKFLEDKFEQFKEKFGDGEIPLPEYWGGYRLVPNYFEFWQGRENRLHDRICYRKESDKWEIFRLAP